MENHDHALFDETWRVKNEVKMRIVFKNAETFFPALKIVDDILKCTSIVTNVRVS